MTEVYFGISDHIEEEKSEKFIVIKVEVSNKEKLKQIMHERIDLLVDAFFSGEQE